MIERVNLMATAIACRLRREERGQTMAEYALVLALVAVAVVVSAAFTGLAGAIENKLKLVADALNP